MDRRSLIKQAGIAGILAAGVAPAVQAQTHRRHSKRQRRVLLPACSHQGRPKEKEGQSCLLSLPESASHMR